MIGYKKFKSLLRFILVLSSSRHFSQPKLAEQADILSRIILQFMAAFRKAGYFIAYCNSRSRYHAEGENILLIDNLQCFICGRLHNHPGLVFERIYPPPYKKEKASCPALNVLLTDRLRMRGVRETFKKKAPVLKDEGGLNVFTTE